MNIKNLNKVLILSGALLLPAMAAEVEVDSAVVAASRVRIPPTKGELRNAKELTRQGDIESEFIRAMSIHSLSIARVLLKKPEGQRPGKATIMGVLMSKVSHGCDDTYDEDGIRFLVAELVRLSLVDQGEISEALRIAEARGQVAISDILRQAHPMAAAVEASGCGGGSSESAAGDLSTR